MSERQKRLIEVYEHLRRYFGIHTKTGFAEALHYGRTSMSAAMNGDAKYLTDKLFKNICEAYPGVFDLDYLLTGEGSLLTIEEEAHNQELEGMFQSSPSPQKSEPDTLEVFARMIRTLDDLRVLIKDELAEVQTVKSELQQARNDFRDATYRLTQALRMLDTSQQQLPIAADSAFEEVH